MLNDEAFHKGHKPNAVMIDNETLVIYFQILTKLKLRAQLSPPCTIAGKYSGTSKNVAQNYY